MLLASVPLLIHLFNRQRHKPMKWAAMRFVMAAYKRTRRRAQLENLILLLLRMAAVALLALAISRPFVGDQSPLGAITESRRDLVLILDSSASTDYRMSIQSVFEASVERAGEILADFDGARGDRVRLYAAGSQAKLLSARTPEDALGLLGSLSKPSGEALDMTQVLAELVQYAEENAAGTGKSSIEVRLLSDLQRSAFTPKAWMQDALPESEADQDPAGTEDSGASEESWQGDLDRLAELGVRILVEDLGAGELTPANLGIEGIEVLGELQGPGLTNEIAVHVRNHGAKPKGQVRVALKLDGVRQQVLKVDLEARASSEAIFQVVFKSPGAHTLEASLEGDRLAIDDRRATLLEVPDALNVLLVNGDPSDEIDRDELGYLRAVLEPFADDNSARSTDFSPFRVTLINAINFGFGELDLEPFDMLVLANVGSLSKRMVGELEQRVGAGAALLITLGDHSADRGAIEALNSRLWKVDGTGLLPAKLFRQRSASADAYYRVSSFAEEHPALSFFADERWRPYFTEVPFYSFVAVEDYERAKVLASFDDEEHHPLLLERDFNRGKVLLWTSSIDTAWNRVGDSPSTLIPLVHELFRYATNSAAGKRNLAVGDTLYLEVESFPRDPSLVPPDGTRRPIDGEATQVVEGRWQLPEVSGLDRTGIWQVEWEGLSQPFTVEVDPNEGDLQRISPLELEASHSVWRMAGMEEGEQGGAEDSSRGELWRLIAAIALAMLVAETLWSAWLGRRRRLA